MRRRFYDEGDGGGGNQDAGAVTPAKDTNLESGATGDGGGGGEKVEETPDQIITRLTAENTQFKEDNTNLSTKLGKQSSIVGTMNKFSEALQKDPKAFIQQLARDNKVSFKFDEVAAPDVGKTISEGSAEDVNAALSENQQIANAQIMEQFKSVIEPIQENIFANKYKDYDDLSDTRQALNLAVKGGQLNPTELLHYAARGVNMETALEDYGKQAVEQYKADLSKKAEEHVDGAGSGGGVRSKENAVFIENVLDQLNT